MFVQHCRVITEQKLELEGGGAGPAPPESLHPVHCAKCGTEVGVLDEDEIYHFFSALPAEG